MLQPNWKRALAAGENLPHHFGAGLFQFPAGQRERDGRCSSRKVPRVRSFQLQSVKKDEMDMETIWVGKKEREREKLQRSLRRHCDKSKSQETRSDISKCSDDRVQEPTHPPDSLPELTQFWEFLQRELSILLERLQNNSARHLTPHPRAHDHRIEMSHAFIAVCSRYACATFQLLHRDHDSFVPSTMLVWTLHTFPPQA